MATEFQLTASVHLESQQLYADVCKIIDDTRSRIAVYVNSEVCHTNWLIGKRIKEDVLFNKRAEYGKQILQNLAHLLSDKYGKGWGGLHAATLCTRCVHFYRGRDSVRGAYTIQLDSFEGSF